MAPALPSCVRARSASGPAPGSGGGGVIYGGWGVGTTPHPGRRGRDHPVPPGHRAASGTRSVVFGNGTQTPSGRPP